MGGMTSALLQQWMAHPEVLDRGTLDELRGVLAQYPYFQSAWLLYLKNLYDLHDECFGDELHKAVPYVADRAVLFQLTEGEHYAMQLWVEPEPAASETSEGGDRTLTLIDAFLAQAPEEERQPLPVEGLDYAMDYTSYLLQEDESGSDGTEASGTPQLHGQALIDSFIQKQSEPAASIAVSEIPAVPAQTSETGTPAAEGELDESCFTETLAKIYIKQHRYEKALEIIKKLSLNYPKKNAYFADQIRFLEKLIINANSK